MSMDDLFRCLDVSASALKAERTRMDIVAQNIANAGATRTESGGPYRRREVHFESLVGRGAKGFGGVRVKGVVLDDSPFIELHNPGHPDADENGVVLMPNVKVPYEMVDMITAARAYEANLNLIRTFREMVERAINLGR
jgi:flagellar basal-body rod protein FlgC